MTTKKRTIPKAPESKTPRRRGQNSSSAARSQSSRRLAEQERERREAEEYDLGLLEEFGRCSLCNWVKGYCGCFNEAD